MENTKLAERNLLVIIIAVLAIAVIIVLAYNFSFFLKQPGMDVQDKDLPAPETPKEETDQEEEYKRIIEKSKADYKAFMERSRATNK